MKAYRKAIAGFFGSTVAAFGTSMMDGKLTSTEAIAAIGIGLVAAATVYAAPRNQPN